MTTSLFAASGLRPQDLTFFSDSDQVVLYCDGEFADMSNPRGDVYGYAVYVYAELPDGSRLRRFVGNDRWKMDRSDPGHPGVKAERCAQVLAENARRGYFPKDFDKRGTWANVQPAYGSQAYQRDGGERALMALDDCDQEF